MNDKSVNLCAVLEKEGVKEIVGYDSYILMYVLVVWYLRKKAKERAGIVTVTVPFI
jgi:hypothetical protein